MVRFVLLNFSDIHLLWGATEGWFAADLKLTFREEHFRASKMTASRKRKWADK